jgi:hypothetical protein
MEPIIGANPITEQMIRIARGKVKHHGSYR